MDKIGTVLILEGSEQCGKTTLGQKIQNEFKALYLHGSRPLDNNFEEYHKTMLATALYFARQGHVVVIDRCFISHEIYNTMFDGAPQYDTHQLYEEFKTSCVEAGLNFKIIYCRPERTFDPNLREEMYDDSDGKIQLAFDKEMSHYLAEDAVWAYNWQEEPTGQSIINRIKEEL